MKRFILFASGIAAVLALTACDSIGDPFGRKSSASTTSSTTTNTQNNGGKSAEDATWERVMSVPVPTAEHLPAKCPGATNAEIDAALNSNEPWVCHAATREAAK